MADKLQYRLGVDLGGTKTEGVIMASDRSIVARRRIATPTGDYEAILLSIGELCDDLENELGLATALPLGIGTPGSSSPKNGQMRNANSLALNGRQLRTDLEASCSRRVRIANDADCFALSEAVDGAAAGSASSFGVILGTGVGGGLCLGPRLLAGPNAIVGEWGHIRLPIERIDALPPQLSGPRLCYCGKNDCVETWLSGPGLALTHELLHGSPLNLNTLHEDVPGIEAKLTLETYAALLAAGLAAVLNIVDPHTVVIGGGLSNIKALYRLLPALVAQQLFSDVCLTKIHPAMHGDSSGVRGAAWLW